MATHVWGSSRLNHGSQQCKNCHCTWEEHQATKRIFGEDCPQAPVEGPTVAKVNDLTTTHKET